MLAILGEELAELLVSKGFELLKTKEGKVTKVFYFEDSEAIHEEVNRYLAEMALFDNNKNF